MIIDETGLCHVIIVTAHTSLETVNNFSASISLNKQLVPFYGPRCIYTYGDSDVISMPADFRRHLLGKTLINVYHCDIAEILLAS